MYTANADMYIHIYTYMSVYVQALDASLPCSKSYPRHLLELEALSKSYMDGWWAFFFGLWKLWVSLQSVQSAIPIGSMGLVYSNLPVYSYHKNHPSM